MQVNRTYILIALVVLVMFGIGAYLAIFAAGGTVEQQTVRAGLVTTLLAPVIGVLALLLQQGAQQQQLNGQQEQLNGTRTAVKQVNDRLNSVASETGRDDLVDDVHLPHPEEA